MKKEVIRWFMKVRDMHLKTLNSLKPNDPLKYCGEYHFILKHGKIYKFHPRRTYVKSSSTPVIENQCYRNSIHYALKSGMRYVEGYGISQNRGLMDHAWCINEHNNVRDVSWDDGILYFGVELPIDYVTAKNEGATDYFSCYPILREEDESWLYHDGILDFNFATKTEEEINPRCKELLMDKFRLN